MRVLESLHVQALVSLITGNKVLETCDDGLIEFLGVSFRLRVVCRRAQMFDA